MTKASWRTATSPSASDLRPFPPPPSPSPDVEFNVSGMFAMPAPASGSSNHLDYDCSTVERKRPGSMVCPEPSDASRKERYGPDRQSPHPHPQTRTLTPIPSVLTSGPLQPPEAPVLLPCSPANV